ncbi:hypothetical protein CISIN_1g034858mg [Citrus sinensis]|uniref:Uncharacterized protein n=1 Tax=Citrus sinensis TaxID=2711 RepID=A0A067D524_CITSI|nr:hypothetical protein CISIN_1g034858mg [Citrus sinensis]
MFLKGPLNYLMKLESCYCLNESTIFCRQGIPRMMRLCDCYLLLNYLLNQVFLIKYIILFTIFAISEFANAMMSKQAQALDL